jgi:6-phosphogluconolactonase
LFGASYAAHLISVNAVGSDGRVAAEPLQVIPVGRNAHSIRIDATNKFVYVPTLGTDQIFQFTFDAKSGHLIAEEIKRRLRTEVFVTRIEAKHG